MIVGGECSPNGCSDPKKHSPTSHAPLQLYKKNKDLMKRKMSWEKRISFNSSTHQERV